MVTSALRNCHDLARVDDVWKFKNCLVDAIKNKLDINQCCGNLNRSILHAASYNGCSRNIAELLEGAGKEAGFRSINDVDAFGDTALHDACARQHEACALELLEKSGKRAGFTAISTKNNQGRTFYF